LSYKSLQREPILSYYLAESYLQQGKLELAEAIAAAALESTPSAADGSLMPPPAATANEDPLRSTLESTLGYRNLSNKERRRVIGDKLADRGLFSWAERELKIAATDDLTLPTTLRSLNRLAELQHSHERFDDATATLKVFVDRFEKEPLFRDQVRDMTFFTSSILSHYYLYAGDAERAKKNSDLAIAHYNHSLEIDSDNVDALIGLFKVEGGSDDHKQNCRAKLKTLTIELRRKVRDLEDMTRVVPSNQYAEAARALANSMNSLAWVVSNTEGDFEEALEMSRQAVQLDPDEPALLDTLAHCYFAAGKWDDAVEQQSKAVELKPNDPDLRRALSRFEERRAREETKSSKP
jgi:tetratricopeptide (TPR) repeat protein